MKLWKKRNRVVLCLLAVACLMTGCRNKAGNEKVEEKTTEPTTEPIIYSITYVPNGGQIPYDSDIDYSLEDPAELPEPKRPNYEFIGWYLEEDFSGYLYADTVGETGDKVFYAKWAPVEYSITYDLGGGKMPDGVKNPSSYSVESEDIVLNAPVKNGYVFAGWVEKKVEDLNESTDPTEVSSEEIDKGRVSDSVTIVKGSYGDKEFVAKWAAANPTTNKTNTKVGGGSTANAHSHNYVNVKTVKATCYNEKYTLKRCSCGDEYREVSGDKLDHVWDKWIMVKAETEAENGIRKRSCKLCRIVESEFVNDIVGPDEASGNKKTN